MACSVIPLVSKLFSKLIFDRFHRNQDQHLEQIMLFHFHDFCVATSEMVLSPPTLCFFRSSTMFPASVSRNAKKKLVLGRRQLSVENFHPRTSTHVPSLEAKWRYAPSTCETTSRCFTLRAVSSLILNLTTAYLVLS